MVVLVCNVEIQFYFIFEYCILIAKDFIPQLAAYNSIHQKLSENCLPTRPLSLANDTQTNDTVNVNSNMSY